MSKKEKNTKKEKPTGESIGKKVPLRGILNGSILTRELVITQLPFILFLTLLAIIYIGNRYHAEKIFRETMKIQNELKELRSGKIAVESELMYISKQSEVAKRVVENGLELEESVEPPIKIVINNPN